MVIGYANRSQVRELFTVMTPMYHYVLNGCLRVVFKEMMEPVGFERINEDAFQYIKDNTERMKV